MHLKLDNAPFANVKAPVAPDGRHQAVSFWHETVDIVPNKPLGEHIACDVAVVGGGFTGLTNALYLKKYRPELEVVLIERGVCAHGASGRNGGFAMPLIGWDLLYAVEKLGLEKGGEAYRFMYGAVDHLKQMVKEHNIACDLEETGYILLNTCARREKRARKELAASHKLGFDHQWLEGADLQAHIKCAQFRSGVFDPHPCIINPAKLARGLKDVAERMGVKIYEQTPLEELIDGNPVTLRTPQGSIKARQVVLGLNGFGASVGFKKSRILPVHTYIVLTEPLSDAQLDAVGWREKRASLETARNFIHYTRLTADNRILFGGEDAELFYGGAYDDYFERCFTDLKRAFRTFFPPLKDVKFTHEWGGVLGVTMDMFPTFGVGGDHKNIYHAAGYSGHGVSLANYAGKVLAPKILADIGVRDVPEGPGLPFFWDREPMWLPPDPLRYAGMRVYRQALKLQDKIEGA